MEVVCRYFSSVPVPFHFDDKLHWFTKRFCCQVSGNQGVSVLHFSGCKIDTSGNASFCHLYCTLTEHSDFPHNSKYRVTSSTPLHTGTKCLPRQLIVYVISHFRVGFFLFYQVLCVSPSMTRVTRRYTMLQCSFEQITVAVMNF